MKVETPAEQLFFTTVFIETVSAHGISRATGFVYNAKSTKGVHSLLVTNRHVLDGASEIKVRFIRRGEGNQPLLGTSSEAHFCDFDKTKWVGHPDENVDIAVMALSPFLNQAEALNTPCFYKSVDRSIAINPEIEEKLNAVESVKFIGYPNGLFDSANLLPIMRTGITATPIQIDFENRPTFLIDANVYQGSSGSPVFIFDQGIYSERNGNSVVGTRLIFLGVISGNYHRTSETEALETPTATIVKFREAIGLGLVFKARCVDQCVDAFLALHKLEQLN